MPRGKRQGGMVCGSASQQLVLHHWSGFTVAASGIGNALNVCAEKLTLNLVCSKLHPRKCCVGLPVCAIASTFMSGVSVLFVEDFCCF